MLEMRPLIRYGLPGYILLFAGLICGTAADISVRPPSGLAESDAAVSVALLIAGPFVGFVLHQLYFVYFDAFESYDTSRRPCVRLLMAWYREGDTSLADADAERLAYVSWKLVMTGSASAPAAGPVMIQALADLHYYAHSFGTVLLATLLALALGVSSLFAHLPSALGAVSYGAVFLLLSVVFWLKRRDLVQRVDVLERAILLTKRDLFLGTMQQLAAADRATPTGLLSARGRHVKRGGGPLSG